MNPEKELFKVTILRAAYNVWIYETMRGPGPRTPEELTLAQSLLEKLKGIGEQAKEVSEEDYAAGWRTPYRIPQGIVSKELQITREELRYLKERHEKVVHNVPVDYADSYLEQRALLEDAEKVKNG